MTQLKNSNWPNFDRTIQFLMVGAVIVLISLLYPSSVKFKYQFQRGQEWRYADLYAPFDFPIKKTESEIARELAERQNDITPYYRFNKELKDAKLKDCEAAIQNWERDTSTSIKGLQKRQVVKKCNNVIEKMLSGMLTRGIIALDDSHQGSSDDFVLNIIDGREIYKRTLTSYITIEQAKQMFLDSLAKMEVVVPPSLQVSLLDAFAANITYDKEKTAEATKILLAGFVSTKGLVRQGELIVQRGNLITNEVFEKLSSFRDKYASDISSLRSSGVVYLGYLLITLLIFVALMMYINAYIKDLLLNWKHLAFILMWVLVFSYLTFILSKTNVMNAYLVPYCIVPVVISHFFNFRLAFFAHVIVILVAGFLTTLGFPFVFMQIVAGVVAVLAVADARDWSKFFKNVLAIITAYLLAYLGVSLIEEGSFLKMDWEVYGMLLFNGLLTLLAFPLIPLAEKMFGFTTSISLVELSNMNRPLLRELAIKAPGTLQHSLQVGNLCEAAAREIGANELLVRVAALYHDIGKMENPEYFIENQGSINPHEQLSAIESARIIIRHVTQGAIMAKKHKLPKSIIRFINTHHSKTRVDYFYKTYLQNNPGVTIDEQDFTYPGPKPVSKEEGIMMLADTIEAASRSLKDPSVEDINNLVEKLVASKVKTGQLSECALTYGDVEKCKEIFKKQTQSVLHVRIEYPE